MFEADDATRLYDYLGARLVEIKGGKYLYLFRTYEPECHRVELILDICGRDAVQLCRKEKKGIHEVILESEIPLEGVRYKYRLFFDKSVELRYDRFSRYTEHGESAASIVVGSEAFEWQDELHISHRRKSSARNEPVNIAEISLEAYGQANYMDIANEILNDEMLSCFTHFKLSFERSAGFGFYFPSARYGSPEDLKAFVNSIHQSGKGVIISLETDPEYELMLSSSLFWLREFHFDGISISNVNDHRIFDSIKSEFSDVITISDQNSGLNTTVVQNQIWRQDVLAHVGASPESRKAKFEPLRYSMRYAFCDSFLLPLNVDELLTRAYGILAQKNDQAKLVLTEMMTHPGKKLMKFTNMPVSPEFRRFIIRLSGFYLEHSVLWRSDNAKDSFELSDPKCKCEDALVYKRSDRDGGELICAFNYSLCRYKRLRISEHGDTASRYRLAFKSKTADALKENTVFDLRRDMIDIPPLCALIFELEKEKK